MRNNKKMDANEKQMIVCGMAIFVAICMIFYLLVCIFKSFNYFMGTLFLAIGIWIIYYALGYMKRLNTVDDYRKNLPAYLEAAKAKYENTIKELGKPENCFNDGQRDMWFADGMLVRIKKWEDFEKEIVGSDSKYIDDIVSGQAGEQINFEYQIIELDKLPVKGAGGIEHHLNMGKSYVEKTVAEEDAKKDMNTIKEFFSKVVMG